MSIDSKSIFLALEEWSRIERETFEGEKPSQAYLRIVNEGGQTKLQAVNARDLGWTDRLKAHFHVGNFSLSKIIRIVEQANPRPEDLSLEEEAALRHLRDRVQKSFFRHKSKKDALINRVATLLQYPQKASGKESESSQGGIVPIAWENEWKEEYKSSAHLLGQTLAQTLLTHKEFLPNLTYFERGLETPRGAYQPTTSLATANVHSVLRQAIQSPDTILKRQPSGRTLAQDLGQSLETIIETLGTSRALQLLSTMFNVKIRIVDKTGNELHVIEPHKTRGDTIPPSIIELNALGFSNVVSLDQQPPPPPEGPPTPTEKPNRLDTPP